MQIFQATNQQKMASCQGFSYMTKTDRGLDMKSVWFFCLFTRMPWQSFRLKRCSFFSCSHEIAASENKHSQFPILSQVNILSLPKPFPSFSHPFQTEHQNPFTGQTPYQRLEVGCLEECALFQWDVDWIPSGVIKHGWLENGR